VTIRAVVFDIGSVLEVIDESVFPAPFEQRLESGAEIVNDLVGEVEPGCDSREDELGDVLEALVVRNREDDPVGRHSRPAPTTTSSS